jgi:hypothetical protein
MTKRKKLCGCGKKRAKCLRDEAKLKVAVAGLVRLLNGEGL